MDFTLSTTHLSAREIAQQAWLAGDSATAFSLYGELAQKEPKVAGIWHEWGVVAAHINNLDKAAELFSRAVSLDGSNALYRRNLCESFRRLGNVEAAVSHGRKAVELEPRNFDGHYNLGLSLFSVGRWQEAREAFSEATRLAPNKSTAWNNLGSTLEKLNETEEAETCYRQACMIDPGNAEAANNLGALLSFDGNIDKAKECFTKAIQAKPTFIDPHFNLSSLKRYGEGDPHLHILESLVLSEQRPRNAEELTRLCFALGKAREDIGSFDAAFAAYQFGNKLHFRSAPVDEQREQSTLKNVVAICDEAFLNCGTCDRNEGPSPIFIVGVPRSGTTLVEQILSSHPRVYGAGELPDLSRSISAVLKDAGLSEFPSGLKNVTNSQLGSIRDVYLAGVQPLSPRATFICDKMPTNFMFLGLIYRALPNAKIINVLRDPVDAAFSCYSRHFKNSMNFTYSLPSIASFINRYRQIMKHWHEVLPSGFILDVSYEDLVDDLEDKTRKMLSFIGLDWAPECLKFYESDRIVRTASVAQVREPLYASSVGRGKRFDRYLGDLKDHLISV